MGKLLDIAASVEKSPVTRVLLGIVLGVSSVLIDKKMNNRNARPLINAMALITGSDGMKYDIKPGAQLVGAQLAGVDLSRADLSRADLRNANLTGANLTNANLSGAILTKANLTNAKLTGADLRNASLGAATLKGVIGKINGFFGTRLPDGWKLVKGYLIGPGANLTDADLSGADLKGDNLTGANLTGANLTDANLSDANLSGADLRGANLTKANLTGANLKGVISGGITGSNYKLPVGWKLVKSYLIGPGANLTDANLTKANLTDANLIGANLTDANLTGAKLTGAGLSDDKKYYKTKGKPVSLPKSWKYMPYKKDKSGTILEGIYFSG